MSSAPNISEIELYCNFLTKYLPTKNFTWAFLDSQSNGVIKGFGTLVCDVNQMLEKYNQLCSQYLSETKYPELVAYPTVHVTLNQTNDKGRKNSDIEAARVFCVDLDYEISEETLQELINATLPEMAVQSSPNKYHLYWHCNPSILLDDWKQVQTALAGYFGADLNLSSLCKTIRVPGFSRMTKQGQLFMPSIVYLETQGQGQGQRQGQNDTAFPENKPKFLTDDLFTRSLSYAATMQDSQRKEQQKLAKQVKEKLLNSKLLTSNPSNNASSLSVAGRNTTLFTLVKEFVANSFPGEDLIVSEEDAINYGIEVNNTFNPPLDETERETTVQSAYKAGLALKEKRLTKIQETKKQIEDYFAEPISNGVINCSNEVTNMQTNELPLITGQINEAMLHDSTLHDSTLHDSTLHDSTITACIDSQLSEFNYNLEHKAIKSLHFSDYAIAERVMQRYKDYILECDGTIIAFNPDTKLWKEQTDNCSEIKHFCKEVLIETVNNPEIVYECLTPEGEVSQLKLKKLKERFLSAGMLSAVAGLVRSSIHHKKVSKDIFDAVVNIFYCKNGVLNLSTGELREAKPTDYLNARSDVEYIPDAECPGFKEFLKEIFYNNDDPQAMYLFTQEMFGYSISGSIQEQKMFIHIGAGSNGKSKVLTALTKLLGDYANYMAPDELVTGGKNSFAKAFEEIGAKLEGHRVAVIDDMDNEGTWKESFVKNLTSTKVRARGKYERSRWFANRAKVHVGLNNPPKLGEESYGLIRRMCMIPYNRRFEPKASTSDRIDKMLEAELSGILNWAVEGFKRWEMRGYIAIPQELQTEIDSYKEDTFVQENLVTSLFTEVPEHLRSSKTGLFAHDIYAHYVNGCALAGIKPQYNQQCLLKYVQSVFNVRSDKTWCFEKRNSVRKLQVQYK